MIKVQHLRKLYHITFLLGIMCIQPVFSQVTEMTEPLLVDLKKSKIITRFTPPKGYFWMKEQPGSFGEYLVNFPLHPPGFPVRDYRMVPVKTQDRHMALLKIDVGDKDLQQCADAWMRLYAEYLWSQKRFDEIGFEFTSGQFFAWKDYKNGIRTKESKKKVSFYDAGIADESYTAFRDYLNIIFRYAGTISLDREAVPVTQNSDIKTGDFIIKPGSPGHSVIIMGIARNNAGKRVYLLAESFMPAQDIHILKNTVYPELSPWYELDVDAPRTITAKYTFSPTSIKRFRALK